MWKEYKNTGYWVCDDGRVYSPFRVILKQFPHGNGYLGVDIWGKKHLVHRLVAETFLPNPNNLEIVNHIDGNKHNCRLSNLEWCDRSYNQIHAYQHGLQRIKRSSQHHRSLPVIMVGKDGTDLMEFASLTEAAEFVHIKAYGNIASCCRGKREFAGGFRWRFKNIVV